MTIPLGWITGTVPYIAVGLLVLVLLRQSKHGAQLADIRRRTRRLEMRFQATTTRLYNAAGVPAPVTSHDWAQEVTTMLAVNPDPICAVVFDPDDPEVDYLVED